MAAAEAATAAAAASNEQRHNIYTDTHSIANTYFNAARNLINHILDSLLITSDQAFSLSPPMTLTGKNAESKNARAHIHIHIYIYIYIYIF